MNLNDLKTPCYVIDEGKLIKNLEILANVKKESGAHILLASKAFSSYATFKLIGKYLDGVTSSGLNEARLGYEEMQKQTHIFAPAYKEDEFDEILKYCDHIIFNSKNQLEKYLPKITTQSIGLRINPQYSEIETEIYNPCASKSRLGITLDKLEEIDLSRVEGLHFHTMCEQNSDTLWRTIQVIDQNFSKYLKKMKWINFGGGHHITKDDYDIKTLIKCIKFFQDKYNLEVYLEPGEAIALNAGYLVTSVLDIVENDMNIAILDTSAACHMPDVLEMPYRPNVVNSGKLNEYKYNYRFGGPTCLAGDIIGDYSFEKPLKINDKLIFLDMAIYTMVKNNTFNGINLPSIYILKEDGTTHLHKSFNYLDFKSRL